MKVFCLSASAVALACCAGRAQAFLSSPLLPQPSHRQHGQQQLAGAGVRMTATVAPTFSLPLADDTRITIHGFQRSHAVALANEVNNILSAFKRLRASRVEGGKPSKEKSVEFIVHAAGGTTIEIECNPNLYPDPFKAMVFVKVLDETIEVASQAQLTKLADVIKSFLAATKED